MVTGGNIGMGLGVAKAYAQEGAQVAITGRNASTLEAAAKEIGEGTLAIQSDAGKVAEIEAAMKKIKERFGRIDALFVNAGVGQFVPFEQITEKFFDETVNINMKGVFFTVQKAIPLMSKGSAVVLNADQRTPGHAGDHGVRRNQSGRSQHGQNTLGRSTGKGIRVNAISPGPITSARLARDGITRKKFRKPKIGSRGLAVRS